MKWISFGFGMIGLILLSACGGGGSPAATLPPTLPPTPAPTSVAVDGVSVDSVTLARDDGSGKPGETVTSFRPTDRTFYALVKLNQLKAGLKIKFSWVAVVAAGSMNQELGKEEYTTLTTTTITNFLKLPQDWPIGAYRLNIYLNDTLAKSVDFTVA